jgi:hypothetical protein
MRIKVVISLAMALIFAGLLWLNRPHSSTIAPPPPPAPTALPKLPNHFAGTSRKSPDEPQPANSIRQLWLKGGDPLKLTAAQIAEYLQANHRSAESLIAAIHTTGDRSYLREAMTNFPNDPKVNFAALFFGNLSPEQMRQQADNFKRADPNNAMADYASALTYMKSGQTDLALQDMSTAASLKWSDYSAQFIQSSEEAYRSAGYSDLDAKAAAESQILLPDLAQLKQLSKDIAAQASSYQQAGDPASAQATLQMDLRLGQQLSATDAQPLITTLVGLAVQRIALDSMDPNASYGDTGQTVQDQINQLQQQRNNIKNLVNQGAALVPIMSDDDLLNYLQRRQNFGELSAISWAVNKYSPQ